MAAEWLERLGWQDVRGFLKDAGEVLKRLREQLNGGDQANELEERRESLEKRLANEPGESDRAIRLYMGGLISEEEAEVLLAELKNEADNFRLLIRPAESDLSKQEENKLAAQTTAAWLMTLKENLSEVEQETE